MEMQMERGEALKLVESVPVEEKQDRIAYMLQLATDRGQHVVSAMEITDTIGGITVKYRIEF